MIRPLANNRDRERLLFLCRIVRKEVQHLEDTVVRLFPVSHALTADDVQNWIAVPELSERLDAFVARFSRLQDTVGDKLLPALLQLLGDNVGPVIDNLNKAEKFGWIDSAEDWVLYRTLRNQMVHEYIEDINVLTSALKAGQSYVPVLVQISTRIVSEVEQRTQL